MAGEQENEVIEMLAEKAYRGSCGTEPATAFSDLPAEERSVYRRIAEAVLEGMTPHVTLLMGEIGNRAHRAEHRAQTLSGQLVEARAWALENEALIKRVVGLLKESRVYVERHGLIGEGSLLTRIDEAVAEVENL